MQFLLVLLFFSRYIFFCKHMHGVLIVLYYVIAFDKQRSYLLVLSIIVDTISQKIYKPASIYYSTYSLR